MSLVPLVGSYESRPLSSSPSVKQVTVRVRSSTKSAPLKNLHRAAPEHGAPVRRVHPLQLVHAELLVLHGQGAVLACR